MTIGVQSAQDLVIAYLQQAEGHLNPTVNALPSGRSGQLVFCHAETGQLFLVEHDGQVVNMTTHWERQRLEDRSFTLTRYGFPARYAVVKTTIGGCFALRLDDGMMFVLSTEEIVAAQLSN